MSDDALLSAEAAADRRRIAAGEPQPTPETICLDCGHLNSPEAVNCAACHAGLMVPMGTLSEGYLTAVELLRSGQLAPNQVQALLADLQRVQALYTAGTKYSVFC